jgi:hypothetical protein
VNTLELSPDLASSGRANGDGCTKPIGRRARGRRRGSAPRKSSAIAHRLLELRRLVEHQHADARRLNGARRRWTRRLEQRPPEGDAADEIRATPSSRI